MMSPHIAKLLLHKIKKNHKLSQTVHEKFRPIVHEKKCLIKWQILIDKCKFMCA